VPKIVAGHAWLGLAELLSSRKYLRPGVITLRVDGVEVPIPPEARTVQCFNIHSSATVGLALFTTLFCSQNTVQCPLMAACVVHVNNLAPGSDNSKPRGSTSSGRGRAARASCRTTTRPTSATGWWRWWRRTAWWGAVQRECGLPLALKGAWFQPLNLSSEKLVSQSLPGAWFQPFEPIK
jgi:hypothetical protein